MVGVIVIVTLVAIAVVAVLRSSRSDPPRATPPPPPPPAAAPAPPRATPLPPTVAAEPPLTTTTTRAALPPASTNRDSWIESCVSGAIAIDIDDDGRPLPMGRDSTSLSQICAGAKERLDLIVALGSFGRPCVEDLSLAIIRDDFPVLYLGATLATLHVIHSAYVADTQGRDPIEAMDRAVKEIVPGLDVDNWAATYSVLYDDPSRPRRSAVLNAGLTDLMICAS